MTMVATAKFRQQFTIGNGRIFTTEETTLLQDLYQNYTDIFGPRMAADGRINSTCLVDFQVGLNRRRLGGGANQEGRQLQAFLLNAVDYTMTYTSKHSDVAEYPLLFQNYVNDNLDIVTLDIQNLGLNVTDAGSVLNIVVPPVVSPAPSMTPKPSAVPSLRPTASKLPSPLPSELPSLTPSRQASAMPTAPPSSPLPTIKVTIDVTPQPSESPSDAPTPPPTQEKKKSGLSDNTKIVIPIVVAGSVVLMGLFFYYRRRKFLQEQEYQANAVSGMNNNSRKAEHAGGGGPTDEGSWNTAVRKPPGFEGPASAAPGTPFNNGGYNGKVPVSTGPGGMVSPSESLVSNQSLLSAGNSMAGDSGDEADATQNLADEFDQYKDQNLEKMRADVEGNLTGFDGMMSQALTKALIDDDDLQLDPTELLWGGAGTRTGPEIEASALGEVTDWLKRKENVSVEEK
jgi:hypothetical protein